MSEYDSPCFAYLKQVRRVWEFVRFGTNACTPLSVNCSCETIRLCQGLPLLQRVRMAVRLSAFVCVTLCV